MKEIIAYCGLDCEKCDAYKATINDDDELRKKVASLWSKMNEVTITPEMINCVGCRAKGVKTPFCENLCPIRQCANGNKYEKCGDCDKLHTCQKVSMVISTNKEARDNLIKK